ncbi:hypothetical protein C8Q80DRAFT_467222 [Daedaleopsis nitida]|nr:hypothetical protein C8Q80DRAFT_467222 [Daedaleopsis nitida]
MPQIHIARRLSFAKSLRTVHLNLDYHDDHGEYCGKYQVRTDWFKFFKDERGPEIVDIMQDCPTSLYFTMGLLIRRGLSSIHCVVLNSASSSLTTPRTKTSNHALFDGTMPLVLES